MLILGLALALALPAAAQAKPKPTRYLVSLGDSYATGYQATAAGQGQNTRNGFANQVPKLARARGHRFKLVNFGCAGESTTSLLERTTACGAETLDGPDYSGRTQIAAAERFLHRNRRKIGLVTVSVGGNDVTRCALEADPIACVGTAVQQIHDNVGEIAERLREAAGKRVRIAGITYPDVILGKWIGADADQDLARLSVVAFKSLINPALEQAYTAVKARFVDVTAASGAYGSLEELTPLPPDQFVPVPVARVCELTYYCEFRDIHARTNGYRLIAKRIVKTLPKRSARR